MYKDYNDYELLNYISENNEEANEIIFKKYEPLIISLSKDMIKYAKNNGIDINDMIQEGMIGLSNAINTFKDSKETLFYTYAKTCIKRKMIDLLISTNRLKNKALNSSISFNLDDEKDLFYLAKDETTNPESILLKTESEEEIKKFANKELSSIELEVFKLKINGYSYKEIAEILDMNPKKVDNTLQRIKNKLKQFV